MIGLTRIGVVVSIVFLYQVLSLLASSTKYLMANIDIIIKKYDALNRKVQLKKVYYKDKTINT